MSGIDSACARRSRVSRSDATDTHLIEWIFMPVDHPEVPASAPDRRPVDKSQAVKKETPEVAEQGMFVYTRWVHACRMRSIAISKAYIQGIRGWHLLVMMLSQRGHVLSSARKICLASSMPEGATPVVRRAGRAPRRNLRRQA